MDQNKKELITFLNEYVAFFNGILDDEKEKLKKFLTFDLTQINESIAKQQANQMRIKNMEDKREKVQSSLGIGGKTFKEIIDIYGNDQELCALYKELEHIIDETKLYNRKAMELAASQLKMFEAIKGTKDYKEDRLVNEKI